MLKSESKFSAKRRKASAFSLQPSAQARAGFTLIELLVTLVLMSLIVLALMAVFDSTQKAFRAGLTQTDILESGRLAMGLMADDLRDMTPSFRPVNTNTPPSDYWRSLPYLANADFNNLNNNFNFCAVIANNETAPAPLYQSLIGSNPTIVRTNVLENFFSLSRQNLNGTPTWVGTGYAVFTSTPDTNGLYPLYRFYMTTNVAASPASLFNAFASYQYANSNYWSHLMDGVVDLTVRPYDTNGLEMTNTFENDYLGTTGLLFTNQSTFFLAPYLGARGFFMYSNTVPASVEVEMGVVEGGTLQHAEGLPDLDAQMNYLSNHVGQVHLFRQRIWVRNVGASDYQ